VRAQQWIGQKKNGEKMQQDQWIGEKSNGRGRSSNETNVVRKPGDGETKTKKSKTNSPMLLWRGKVLPGYWGIIYGWCTSCQ
jgi:hypothetical protein